MKPSKILVSLAFILILLVPQSRIYVTSLIQSAVIHTGLVNPTDDFTKDGKFDFNFHLKDLSGNDIDFRKFEGKVVFLNLWATWCGPCRSEMPSIQSLYDKVNKENIVFVMLSADDQFHIEKVKSFVRSQGFTFPVFISTVDLPSQLQVPSIPTTFVVDKSGTIVKKEVGMRNYDTKKFKSFLEQLTM